MADRARMNTCSRWPPTALGQGPSFWHAGTDLLRSKSLDRNSFNSGDWFNRIDWSGQRVDASAPACRRAPTTRPSGPTCGRCSADPALEAGARPTSRAAHDRAAELLRIRFSSPLFRLGTRAR